MNSHVVGKSCKSLSLTIIALLSFIGCNNHPENKTTEASFDKIDSLRATFLTIEDSLVHTWNVMINDDNKKIKRLKRLVQEVIYAGGVDSMITKTLIEEVKQLKLKRYTRKTMADSGLIDYYDLTSNTLVNDIIALASSHEEFGRNIVMDELIEEINQAEGKILFYRLDYDEVAKMHNQFIEQNQAVMEDISSEGNRKKLPIFELPTEE